MALKKEELQNNAEFNALVESQGLNPKEYLENMDKPPTDPPTDPPKTDPPGTDPPTDPPNTDPPVDPPKTDPPPTDPPKDPVSQDDLLKEIFGDRFKTVEEAKSANIAGILSEVETLRNEKTELEGKLNSKPKTNFADDEVALYNEFVKQSGIKNYGVFQKLNSTELSKVSSMDAMVIKYRLDHPNATVTDDRIKANFERKFNNNTDEL